MRSAKGSLEQKWQPAGIQQNLRKRKGGLYSLHDACGVNSSHQEAEGAPSSFIEAAGSGHFPIAERADHEALFVYARWYEWNCD